MEIRELRSVGRAETRNIFDVALCTLLLLLIARIKFSEFSDDWYYR